MQQKGWELNKIKWSTEEEWGSSEDGNALFNGRSHPIEMDPGCKFNRHGKRPMRVSERTLENFMINWCIPFKLRA